MDIPIGDKKTSEVGAFGEEMACTYLKKNGYVVLQRNYRVRTGEIDIIARKGRHIAFVEVKLRRDLRYGQPEESVSPAKISRLLFALKMYLATNAHFDSYSYAIDIIAISKKPSCDQWELHHIKDIHTCF